MKFTARDKKFRGQADYQKCWVDLLSERARTYVRELLLFFLQYVTDIRSALHLALIFSTARAKYTQAHIIILNLICFLALHGSVLCMIRERHVILKAALYSKLFSCS